MSLPRSFLDEIRQRIPLSGVIGKRLKLVRAGREFKGCCPFHQEKTPSFYVNDIKGFYHCFGCGAHGDVIRFLVEHDRMRFMEAVEQLAARAGLALPDLSCQEKDAFKKQSTLYDLFELATQYYQHCLHKPGNKHALSYLKERDISSESISKFRIGFAPVESAQAPESLLKHAQKSGFSTSDLIEAGLYRPSERQESGFYPFFRGRVIFPVLDMQGRTIAYGGRVLPGAPKDSPKYINSPENSLFHKGKTLYALSYARKSIFDGAPVVVTEGYMDVISLHQVGFPGAVAPLGTALTEAQLQEIWKTMPEGLRAPIICFDGDAAGQRAASRALNRILPMLKPDHTARFAFMPENEDPDSFIRREGRSAMERTLNNALNLLDMLWQEEESRRDLNLPESAAGFKKALLERAHSITDETVKKFFISQIHQRIEEFFFAKKIKFPSKSFRPFFSALPPSAAAYRPLRQMARPLRSQRKLREKILLITLINHPGLYEEFSEHFGLLSFEQPEYVQLKQKLISLFEVQNDLDHHQVKTHLMNQGYSKILDELLEESLYLHAGFAKLDQSLDLARQGWIDTYDRGIQRHRLA